MVDNRNRTWGAAFMNAPEFANWTQDHKGNAAHFFLAQVTYQDADRFLSYARKAHRLDPQPFEFDHEDFLAYSRMLQHSLDQGRLAGRMCSP